MSAAQVLEMALYNPLEKEEAMTQINLRMPKSLIADMEAIVRLWKILATHRGDETRGIDRSYVIRRLLRAGRDTAFSEFGGVPTDEAGWEKLEAAVVKVLNKKQR